MAEGGVRGNGAQHLRDAAGEAAVRLESPAAWLGSTLLVNDNAGECGNDTLTGLYAREVRHVSTLRLEIDGARPWLCERARPRTDQLAFVYVHPELADFGGGGSGQSGDEVTTDEHGVPYRSLDLRLLYEIEIDRLRATVRIANRARREVACEVAWVFAADYADLLEATGGKRQQEAEVAAEPGDAAVRLRYGHPQLPFETTVAVAGPGAPRVERDRITTPIRLAPGEQVVLQLAVDCHDPDRPLDEAGRTARQRAREVWRGQMTILRAPSNALVERVLARAVEDLASFAHLEGEPDEWLALQAGVPLYPAFFGRDALTAGWQAAMLDRGAMLDGALSRLGRLQSDRVFDWRDEEPGRIPYQVRTGPLARLGTNPYSAYYADFASPLMYVIGLGNLYAWSGDRDLVRRHFATAKRVLEWARTYGDRDGDGYLEYLTKSSMGTKNQGWKDSGDAIVDEEGTPVAPPIAPCEIQGYWYAAQQLMALLCWVMGERREARAWWREARKLRQRFDRDFWDPRERFYGLALDSKKRLLRVATSNVGHCLASGIVARERRRDVASRLLAPDMFSGWGVRTLSAAHPSYNPLGYHLGSVWAVENATICFGLRRYGFDAEALRVAEGLFALAELYGGYRIPETVGGYSQEDHPTPGAYPRTNTPQTWNASALPLVVQTLLGLVPYASLHALVVDPLLPEWLPELELHGLRVGRTRATLRCWRDEGGRGRAEVVEKDGPLHLVRQPPPEAARAGFGRRMRALLGRGSAAPAS
ncbi:MAG TPA: glycogen debranching N-terminal domain-containing protein [Thermoanaerobaculia bacterium]|nr:glycogen debranching N-terminal domain-containing protein [Thermoanaerobaculia bacterium]